MDDLQAAREKKAITARRADAARPADKLARIRWQAEAALSGFETLTPEGAAASARMSLESILRIAEEGHAIHGRLCAALTHCVNVSDLPREVERTALNALAEHAQRMER